MGEVHREVDVGVFVVEPGFFEEVNGGFVVGVGIDEDHAGAQVDELVSHGREEGGAHARAFAIWVDAQPYAVAIRPGAVFLFDHIAEGESDDGVVSGGHETRVGVGGKKRHDFKFVPCPVEGWPFVGGKQSFPEVEDGSQVADFHLSDFKIVRFLVVSDTCCHRFFRCEKRRLLAIFGFF